MDKKEIRSLLNANKLKATQTRIRLLDVLYKKNSAVSYSSIQKTLKKTDRVTLYRTIQSLTEKGIIHKAFNENNEFYYAICGTNCDDKQHNHNHAHFKCIKCETVTCEDIIQPIEISLSNLVIHKIAVSIEGVCETCS